MEDKTWQRLDKWLWCARFMRARGDCAELAATGFLRINRQPTDKPHARVRVGDVITLPLRGEVRVVEVLGLAIRRGPATEAALLYRDIPAVADGPSCPAVTDGPSCPAVTDGPSCSAPKTAAYRGG